jgi:hypothetical protein
MRRCNQNAQRLASGKEARGVNCAVSDWTIMALNWRGSVVECVRQRCRGRQASATPLSSAGRVS